MNNAINSLEVLRTCKVSNLSSQLFSQKVLSLTFDRVLITPMKPVITES